MNFINGKICALFLVLVACSNSLAESAQLGLVLPLSGPTALMGESLRGVVQASRLQSLSPVFEDDQCDPKRALSAYFKLKQRGIRLFYMACSGSILAVAPHAKRNGDLILTSYAGSSRIRSTGDEVIRLNPDAISIALALKELIVERLRPVAILYEEQEYASSLADKLSEMLGAAVVRRIAYRPDDISLRSEIVSVRQSKAASVIFIPVADGTARIVLAQLAQSGLHIPVLGEVNLCDYPFKPKDFGLSGRCVAARLRGQAYDQFIADYTALLGRQPAFPFYDALAADLFRFIDTLASSNQENLTIQTLKQALLRGFAGQFGRYELSPEGEIQNAGDYLVTVEY